jgi:hypothetical protein
MPAVILEETQHIVSDHWTRWGGSQPTDANRLCGRTTLPHPNDISIRVAKDCRRGMRQFVIQQASVLLFQPMRRALVVVVEKRNERTIRPR